MAHIVQLKGKDKKQIFPRVISDAVITDPEHLTTLYNDLKDIYAGIENINNEVESLKKSQPSSSTTVSGNIVSIILDKSKWDSTSKKQTVSVLGIVADEDYQIIQIAPSNEDSNNVNAYNNASITAISQNNGSIIFAAEIIPTVDITVLVSYMYTDKYKYDSNTIVTAITTTGTGSAYIASVPNIESLTNGLQITIIPHTVSTTKDPTLNINDLGAKNIKLRVANDLNEVVSGDSESWLVANKPIVLCYDGTQWVTNNIMSVDSISDDIINKIDDNTNRLAQIAEQINPYNQYWWRIRQSAGSYNLRLVLSTQMPETFEASTASNGTKYKKVNILETWVRNNGNENDGENQDSRTIQVASNISVDNNGNMSLSNPSSYSISGANFYSQKTTYENRLAGKYVKGLAVNPDTIYKMPSSPSIEQWNASITVSGENTRYYDYYIDARYVNVAVVDYSETISNYTYVSNDNESFYPHSGTQDGVEYQYLGRIPDFVPSLVAYDMKTANITSASWNERKYSFPLTASRYFISCSYGNTYDYNWGFVGIVNDLKMYGISLGYNNSCMIYNGRNHARIYMDNNKNSFYITPQSNALEFSYDSSITSAPIIDVSYFPLV